MQSAVQKCVLRVLPLALLLAASACRRDDRNQTPAPPPPPAAASTTDSAEVFRRAFWRQPAAADRILNAERRVNPADDSWQWFLQLHPGPELLAALRDPENLGLRALPPSTSPRDWPSGPIPPPPWFPAVPIADFEILQHSTSGLTILYRASDNLLYATDHGTGFAAPARPL